MFALRGTIVSLAVFAIVYCVQSLLVLAAWRRIHGWARRLAPLSIANLLFAIRLFPLAGAVVITGAFTVPSFLLFEPRAITERVSPELIALAACGLGLGIFGFANAASALRRATRVISAWLAGARPMAVTSPLHVMRISQVAPAMIAAGVVHPKILVSNAAEFVLTEQELKAALNHEIAHVHRRDNLKKLALRLVPFPGMRGVEEVWLKATEMAADDAAVSSAAEALDLAAALIKLSRLAPRDVTVDLTAAIVTGPMAIVNARIERLVAWSDLHCVQERHFPLAWATVASIATLAGAAAVIYGDLLARVHAATELLVR